MDFSVCEGTLETAMMVPEEVLISVILGIDLVRRASPGLVEVAGWGRAAVGKTLSACTIGCNEYLSTSLILLFNFGGGTAGAILCS